MTAPTKAPPSTGGEYVCVPREPTRKMRNAFHKADEQFNDGTGYSPDHQWSAMLAAAPTGYVPVKRELLERLCSARADWHLALAELRALLSPAPSSGTDNKEQSK